MAVMVPKEDLIEQRLDDLSKNVSEGFARFDKKMDDGFARVDADVRELRSDMTFLQRALLGAAAGVILTLVGVIIQLLLTLTG